MFAKENLKKNFKKPLQIGIWRRTGSKDQNRETSPGFRASAKEGSGES